MAELNVALLKIFLEGEMEEIDCPDEQLIDAAEDRNAHWAIKPKKAFATNLLTLLMTLSPSILLPEPPDILPILVCDTQ